MSRQTLDIERVVRQVLAELGLAPNGDAAVSMQAYTGTRRSNDEPNDEPDRSRELVLTGRVVTLAQTEGRLADVCRLVVPAQAVVTPAVRDELRQRGILLTFASASGKKAAAGNDILDGCVANDRTIRAETRQPRASVGSPPLIGHASLNRLIVTAVGTSFDPESLSDTFASEGVEVAAKQCDCLIRATDELALGLAESDTLGMLVTKHTAAGLCLANRHPGVRAVLGLDAATAASDVASVGANLLVVDPDTIGPFQLKRMAIQFCRGGPAVCPEVFGNRLR